MYSFKRPNVIAFLGKSYLRLGFCEGDCPRGTEYETICLPNEMVGGSEDYLGRQWTLMLFHLEIIRERERHCGLGSLGNIPGVLLSESSAHVCPFH